MPVLQLQDPWYFLIGSSGSYAGLDVDYFWRTTIHGTFPQVLASIVLGRSLALPLGLLTSDRFALGDFDSTAIGTAACTAVELQPYADYGRVLVQ